MIVKKYLLYTVTLTLCLAFVNLASSPSPALSADAGSSAPAKIAVSPHVIIARDQLAVSVDLSEASPANKSARLDVKLLAPGKGAEAAYDPITHEWKQSEVEMTVIAEQEARPDADTGAAWALFSMKGLKPGEYEVQAYLSNGSEPVSARVTWPKKPSWLGSKEGRVDKVLPPWSPVKLQKGKQLTVSTWGRSYTFSDAALVDGVKTQGKSILAAPVRLSAGYKGADLKWQYRPVKLISHTPASAVIEQSASAPGLALKIRTLVEYDGMARMDISLTPLKSVQLDRLSIEVPISRESAKYHYSFGYHLSEFFKYPGDLKPGALPERGSIVGSSKVPLIWLGNDDLGMQWFYDSDINWYNKDPDSATEIACDSRHASLKLNLVDMPIRLVPGKPASDPRGVRVMDPPTKVTGLQYTFGFQATPVKPMDMTCWDYRVVSSPWYSEDYRMLTDKIDGVPALDYLADKGVKTIVLLNWNDIINYVYPTGHVEEFKSVIREAHKRGMKVVPYFVGFLMSAKAPEWPVCGWEALDIRKWPDPTAIGKDNYHGQEPQTVGRLCYQSLAHDYLVDNIARAIEEFDIDGVYLDSTGYLSACRHWAHGCGYVKSDGTLTYTQPTFAVRDMFKRIYTTVKVRKPDGIVDLHVPCINIPAMTWSTSLWNGETLPSAEGKSIFDVIPLDRFRVEFMGRQYGVPADFLHYTLFPKYNPGDFDRALALTLLHDVPVRAHASRENLDSISRIWRLFDDFGRKDAKWLPYWKNKGYVSADAPDVYCSLYANPKTGVLAVVSNLGTKESEVDLSLNIRDLGLSQSCRAVDGIAGDSLKMEDGSIHMVLPSLGWRAIWLKPADH